jgi:glycosyltransferase involved in cell wall biosynthesis
MRILHLSTSTGGGAGIAAVRLNEALNSLNQNSVLYSLDCEDNESAIVKLERSWIRKKQSSALTLLQQLVVQNSNSLVTMFSLSEKNKIKDLLLNYENIHLHAMYNLARISDILELSSPDSKIFIHLHDQRAMTGGCHYSYSCRNYAKVCQKCPQVRRGFHNLMSQKFIENQKKLSDSNKVIVVSPSKWLMKMTKSNLALKDKTILQIRNPIPDTYFESTREVLGKRVITFIAANLNNPYKGFNVFLEALTKIDKSFFGDKIIRIIGRGEFSALPEHIYIERYESYGNSEIMKSLSSTDLLVVPSLEDNSPNVIAEALASGCQIVGTNCGGIPEMLESQGMQLFAKNDAKQLAELLQNHNFQTINSLDRAKIRKLYGYQEVGRNVLASYRL